MSLIEAFIFKFNLAASDLRESSLKAVRVARIYLLNYYLLRIQDLTEHHPTKQAHK